MTRLLSIAAAVALGGGALVAGAASASADDQAAADDAIAGFNERVTEAGGESSGPPDSEPVDPEEYVEENPGSECFGAFSIGLEPGGHVEGETARANADHFSLPGDEGTDEIDAGVVVVDEDHADTIRDFVDALGSDEIASCLQDAFNGLIEAQIEIADASGETVPGSVSFEVTAESDIAVGDASAHLQLTSLYEAEGTSDESHLDLYVAVSGRSLAAITVATEEEPASDFDAVAELEALVDSL